MAERQKSEKPRRAAEAFIMAPPAGRAEHGGRGSQKGTAPAWPKVK
jgi:hypothetical protein